MTGADGSFTINVKSDVATLVISSVGFKTYEVAVGKSISTVSIVLKAAVKGLDEVVVVGYGTQRRRDVTGSVSSIKSEQILQVPVMSAEQALQGRAAGVMVMQSNGAPGGAAQVQIRGVNSTNAGRNGPLFVIDGVPLFDVISTPTASAATSGSPQNNSNSPLATLNPNDIESMEVLKDASATAIYGSRAANGVVVITTKTGKSGKTKVNLDYYQGVQSMTKKLDMLNATEGMLVRRDALMNTISDGGFFGRAFLTEAFNPFSIATSPNFKSVEWQDELFRSAPIQDLNASVSGGTEKLRFLASVNYFKQDGIFRNTDAQRISSRINLDATINPRLKVGLRFAYSNQWGNSVEDGNPFQGTVLQALTTEAWNNAYNADGTYFGPLAPNGQPQGFWNGRNGVYEADQNLRPTIRNRTTGNAFAEYQVIPGLKFKTSIGIDYNTIDNRRIQSALPRGPYLIVSAPDIPPNNSMRSYSTNGNTFNYVWDNTLSYTKAFGEHRIDALVGYSVQQNKQRSLSLRGEGSLNPSLTLIGPNNAANIGGSEAYSELGLLSQFARVNYSFGGKYLFSGTVRRDGSSNFGPENQYGVFPAASVGWRISDEKFMKNVKAISDLKIRASHGVVGNQDIGSFSFIPRMGGANYIFGSTIGNGFAQNGLANTGLRWEENKKTDVAVELSLLKGRIFIIAEYYVNRSEGLLVPVQVPTFSGFGSITTNLGTIENKGYEFTINTENLKGAFSWRTSLNLSTLKNTVLDLGTTAAGGAQEFFGYQPAGTTAPVNVTRRGLPIGSFIGWVRNGIFATQAETVGYPSQVGVIPMAGDAKYMDLDKNGIIDINDRQILGSPFPNFFGGITNDFSYQNFSLSIFANFVVGNEIFNQGRLQREQFLNGWGEVSNLEYWRPGSTNGNPRLTAGAQSQYNRLSSDRFLEDGSFLRLRNVTFSYNFPTRILGRSKIESARIYIAGDNLYTFTNYKGWDPEVNSSGNNVLSGGVDQTGYPVARTIRVGVNIGF